MESATESRKGPSAKKDRETFEENRGNDIGMIPSFSVCRGNFLKEKADVLILSQAEKEKVPVAAVQAADLACGGLFWTAAKEDRFEGKEGETFLFHTRGLLPARRILLVGLGKTSELDAEAIRKAAAVSLREADRLGAKRVIASSLGEGALNLSPDLRVQAMAEGVWLAAYRFEIYKKKPNALRVKDFTVMTLDARVARQAAAGVAWAESVIPGVILARDLVNTPSAHMTPQDLVLAARRLARESRGAVRVKIFQKKDLVRLKAGAVLGMAQGSDHPPALVHLSYRPQTYKKRVALVGKAVTFDSGGLSLKPAEGMFTMKLDMAGAATVLGVFHAISAWKPRVAVDGIFAACENMPSGRAIRPGDVVRALNGTTIEVLHTDAEGRVTLADSLSYAVRQKPDMIIDLATLTGACMVALGEEVSGVFSNREDLSARLVKAGEEAGEKFWPLPLEKAYKREIKSDVADIKNIAGKYGGAVTAALFLQEFVNDVPWAHCDIAGPAFAERPINSYTPKGATGVGVRTIAAFLKTLNPKP